jgi:hypothetical protein
MPHQNSGVSGEKDETARLLRHPAIATLVLLLGLAFILFVAILMVLAHAD